MSNKALRFAFIIHCAAFKQVRPASCFTRRFHQYKYIHSSHTTTMEIDEAEEVEVLPGVFLTDYRTGASAQTPSSLHPRLTKTSFSWKTFEIHCVHR